ncbi:MULTISPECIES: LysR family transcriptional regulator [unclassified Ruegeria]|uniref:LysR family transcriptional regulator n=1 Tax=unclassified Ruegeria TaxID=2625375 RepID=UPI0014928BC1|nr:MULTISPECIES: LysR family transcriptional regulator [unclassified Ruegeria]NOD48998.1 LysR family transcriptional regulator [Ruegeria sp. HKCCD5849]NOD53645.1 LysR family transcriptional regulator [Ruegeria sp. HKCCD5851]NOD69521.1 LysR family transcriptional regulator [Ruegeria sp. HKCCD7303]
MSKIDFTDLDGKVLRTFLTILEESSVSKAADRLGVTQSAISHTLAKLRQVLGDPLFVRSGQGLTPTERALSLKDPVQSVLDGMRALTDERPFDPLSERMEIRIATNDMPRELIFPRLLREFRAEGARLQLEFIPSGVPDPDLLRSDRCQLMLTPLPPDGPDIFQKRLINSPLMVFYDAAQRNPPDTWQAYCNSDHVEVRFADGRSARAVMRGVDQSQIRPSVVTLPHFNAIPAFVRGSNLISTDTALMKQGPLATLDCAPLPFECPPVSIYMVWHQRSANDPAHRWLRARIEAIATTLQT